MTEDIDAVMFGSEVTLLNFSKEVGNSTAATHVSVYRTRRSNDGHPPNVHMDRQAMILFALLSGGDYIPAGVPKCGTKLAGEIVAAGFGKQLMAIFRSGGEDQEAKLAEWRQRLEEELHNNSSGYFKTKHKAIKIPDTFPDKKALLSYAIPIVSSVSELRVLREAIAWNHPIDTEEVKTFAQEVLGWEPTSGAITLTKLLGPPLLTQRMLLQLPLLALFDEDEDTNAPLMCSEKTNTSDDGYDEVRVEFLPMKIVGFTIDEQTVAEATKQQSTTPEIDQELEDAENAEASASQSTGQQSRSISFDPKQRKRIWVPEPVAQLGMADIIKHYRTKQEEKREAQRRAAEEKAKRSEARKAKKNGKKVVDPSMKEGSILKYTKVVKSGAVAVQKLPLTKSEVSPAERNPDLLSSQTDFFSGSSIFNSSQDLPQSAQISRRVDMEEISHTSKNSPSRLETDTNIERHTIDIEAAFDFDYNYEGLRDELAEREASLKRAKMKTSRALKQGRKQASQKSKVSASRRSETSQVSDSSNSSKQSTLKGPHDLADEITSTTRLTTRQKPVIVEEEEEITQTLQTLNISPDSGVKTIQEDFIQKGKDLDISSDMPPVRRAPTKTRRQPQSPASVSGRDRPTNLSRTPASSSGRDRPTDLSGTLAVNHSRIEFPSDQGTMSGTRNSNTVPRPGAKTEVIVISSDDENSEEPPSRNPVAVSPRGNSSSSSNTEQAVASNPTRGLVLPERLKPKEREDSPSEQLKAELNDATQRPNRPVTMHDPNLVIETYNGFWRYRRADSIEKEDAETNRSNRNRPRVWQQEREIWKGPVHFLDLT
ncbi:hypothetical protein KEM56_000940 [Ascosphaera pollenicola]|nr:hypothetical protein KEM56_000940 [Ascosphaera pollenicola]